MVDSYHSRRFPLFHLKIRADLTQFTIQHIAPSAYQARRDEAAHLQGDHKGSPFTTAHSSSQKHAQNKSIAVLKNTMQNEAYMTHIQ